MFDENNRLFLCAQLFFFVFIYMCVTEVWSGVWI